MKTALLMVVAGLGLLPLRAAGAPESDNSPTPAPMIGFSREGAARERELEKQLDGQLNRDHLREYMRRMTAHPHHLGSPYDKELAEWLTVQFRSWGYETEVAEFQVLFPTPRTRLLEMISPVRFTAALAEPPLAADSTSGQTAEQLPTYNAYSPDGDVTGELVYVNYGVPKDYEALESRGIDVKGKIALARYGGSWRGIKPKVAAEHGAIACLIYSDPRDDGYFQGEVYPDGDWRNEKSVQRGSVADMPLYPGDPLTPGVGATPDAKRLSIKDAPSLPRIPVLPLSQADATPLLRALGGQVAPEEWRGALPFTYHLGPGPATVHLKVEFNWDTVVARDVIARMPGADRADEWILRGNHYDAWVCGAEDPISGAVTLLEQARAIGELRKAGWQPQRTVIFTVWDGEEPGLLGSTEWAEANAATLKEHAAVYINSDGNLRGFLHAGGSHTLERFVNEIAREVTDPERNVSVSDRLRAQRLAKAGASDRRELWNRDDFRLDALGSGSDYTPFLQHLGIASLSLEYGGEDASGSYHSIYDSFDSYTRFADTNFDYGILLAETTGRAVLRLANAEVLPFEFMAFADAVERYVGEVSHLADDMREETKDTNRLIRENSLLAAADPRQPFVPPAPKPEVPYLNFAPLQNALVKLRESARRFDDARKSPGTRGHPVHSAETSLALDQILLKLEQTLTSPQGLPRRPWFQHAIYAPGFYTGYGVKTLPGVREAIEQRDWDEAARQIETVAEVLTNFADGINRASKLLR